MTPTANDYHQSARRVLRYQQSLQEQNELLAGEVARLRVALEQVEFVAGWCPWCECFEYHRFNCARQLALTPPTCDCDKGEEVRK